MLSATRRLPEAATRTFELICVVDCACSANDCDTVLEIAWSLRMVPPMPSIACTHCEATVVRQGRRFVVIAVRAFQRDPEQPVASANVHLKIG